MSKKSRQQAEDKTSNIKLQQKCTRSKAKIPKIAVNQEQQKTKAKNKIGITKQQAECGKGKMKRILAKNNRSG